METSWRGVFDMEPESTIQVRAGDLQEFLRQQMMGVTNPGLTVATVDERKDNLSALAQRLRDCKHREFNDGMDVEYAIEEAIGYNGGSLDGLFDRLADLVESSEAIQPERDGETFCEIRWMRDDILEAVNRASGTNLTRDGERAGEVELIIDSVIGEVRKQLEDSSVEEGWGIIDTLMPDEAVSRAKEVANAEHAITKDMVRSGIEQGVIRFVANPDANSPWKTVCAIGDSHFCFVDTEGITPEEYVRMNANNLDMVVDDVWEALNSDVLTDHADDYGRYADILRVERHGGRSSLDVAAYDAADRETATGGLVRDWYMRAYPDDELGERIAPTLTFAEALRAVPSGGDFYVVLGVGDSIVREHVFKELAARAGLSYDDIYERWLSQTPWLLAPNLPLGVLDVMFGPAEHGESGHGNEPQQMSLRSMERSSRAASEQLSESGARGPSCRDEQVK